MPNAGKSSLLNAVVGEEIAVTADMAGTTREDIQGIVNTENAQIIFVDTPGMQKSGNLLEKKMNRMISSAVRSADIICFVMDVSGVGAEEMRKLANYRDFGLPVIVTLNKIDKTTPDKVFETLGKLKQFDFVRAFVPVSAYLGKNIDTLVDEIIKYLPEREPVYGKDEYTDETVRDLTAEIIRGEIIHNLRAEIPHGVAVIIKEFNETNREVKISADIICDKPAHKKIIIGSGGEKIKTIGINARKKAEKLLGRHVVLNTFVVVREGWRNNNEMVNSSFGDA
jgi:GTP-binding protein Era